MTDRVDLALPVPPTVNQYYRTNGQMKGVYLTRKAKGYRHDVAVIINNHGLRGYFGSDRLALRADLYLSSGGDLDNRLKGLLDALQEAHLFDDDKQICDLRVTRGHRVKGGRCNVTVWRL